MRGKGTRLAVAALAAAAVTLGPVVLGFGAPGEQPRRGGVLRVADEAPGGPFGVPWKMPVFGIIPAVPVYETLLWVDARGQVSPKLAVQWEITPDRKGIVFRLRQGVRFHDGSELDADAVKFSLEENLKARRLPPTIQSVDVLDRYTVRVNLSQWNNGIYLSLGGSASLIASLAHLRRLGEDRAQWDPSGTGPFRLTQYDPNAFAMYTRFDRYWDRGKPYLDRLELWFIRSIQTLKAAMLA
ncbi:MAG: ABC transporter substrate-binding protein, partial [Armatimonadota bacterium]|nr:ABC transporter substrate-binding protein [Armatimonadota bacterium]